jgi:AraC family ethanolamine operon transcriptional activator
MYHSHDDLEAVIPPNFTTFTLSIAEDVLGELGHSLKLPLPWELSGRAQVLHCDPVSLNGFHQTLRQIDRQLVNASSGLANPWLSEQLEFDIPQQLLSLLSGATPRSPRPLPRQRTHALKQAVAYIKEHDRTIPPTVRELYQAAGVSKRTLEYAFQEHFGISPKAYLQAYRLNGVRKALREADPHSTKIADVANQWGFWHMGHFANDYRTLFGELPLETLKGSIQQKKNH